MNVPYRESLFTSDFAKRIFARYRTFFSITEIEGDRILQIVFGGLLLSLFVTFSSWFYSDTISISAYLNNTYSCWPYFQTCGSLYFLEPLPLGYSQSLLYTGIFAVMLGIGYFIYKQEWVLAHMLLLILWIWKFFVLFVLTQEFASNYDYYDMILLFIVLFVPYKLFFAKLAFVWLYFLAATIKIHEGWVLGTYFTALQAGLPIFGNAFAPLITSIVIFMQMIGCWFLLSARVIWQQTAFWYFFLFHLFSTVLVGFRYPTVSLVMLIILFGISRVTPHTPLTRRSLVGWFFLLILLGIQLYPIAMIRGDQKVTLEGNKYGLYMFEANHQCVSEFTVYFTDGSTEEQRATSALARNRCDPYVYWFRLHNTCVRDPRIAAIAWTFDHSVNGSPFYRIVDVPDVCTLSYRAFRHNEWIRLPPDETQIIGYPRKNYYR